MTPKLPIKRLLMLLLLLVSVCEVQSRVATSWVIGYPEPAKMMQNSTRRLYVLGLLGLILQRLQHVENVNNIAAVLIHPQPPSLSSLNCHNEGMREVEWMLGLVAQSSPRKKSSAAPADDGDGRSLPQAPAMTWQGICSRGAVLIKGRLSFSGKREYFLGW